MTETTSTGSPGRAFAAPPWTAGFKELRTGWEPYYARPQTLTADMRT